jgi:hypothetical protein
MSATLKLKFTFWLVVWCFTGICAVSAQAEILPSTGDIIETQGQEEKCLECHQGIEEVSRSHPKKLGCTSCHGGDGSSAEKNVAHATLIYDPEAGTGKRNPSSLKVVHLSCGKAQCHSGHLDETRNHVDQVRKSMMGTLAGMITGLRYQWGGQPEKSATYGIYTVEDNDGKTPEAAGARKSLEELPYFNPYHWRQHQPEPSGAPRKKVSNHIGDHVLRERCFQCHIDSPPPPGEYRSQGCAACHFTYHPEGKYLGSDSMISKTQPGHPAYHRMTVLPSSSVCMQCHKSFLSQMTTEKFSIPFPKRNTKGKLPFPGTGQPRMDVHLERGMECIDCHTQSDIMGDGNIYSRQYQAVEIRCETCHGDSKSFPRISKINNALDPAIRLSRHYQGFTNKVGDAMAVSANNRKLTNVKMEGKKFITYSKRTGKARIIPLAKSQRWGHNIPGHREKLSCTSCHSQWVPRCEGCHMTLTSENSNGTAQPNTWNPFQFTMKHEQPGLMIGPRGKVVPMLSQPTHTLTVLDQKEKAVPVIDGYGDSPGEYRHWEFTNAEGYSGSNLAYGTQPHSVSKKVRSCQSCHLSPETLGMGEGDLRIKNNATGKYDRLNSLVRTNKVLNISKFSPRTKINPKGQPIAGTGQQGARPFNQEEITRILNVGNCIPCHPRYSDKIYQDMEKSYKFSINIKHRRMRDKILKKR